MWIDDIYYTTEYVFKRLNSHIYKQHFTFNVFLNSVVSFILEILCIYIM